MSLIRLIDNTRSDKYRSHSYLPVYEKLFESKKDSAKRILEIGVSKGGSIKLWADYFENAQVVGLDKMDRTTLWSVLEDNPRINLHLGINAYDSTIFNTLFAQKLNTFDICIDDGPHTLDSMKIFIQKYTKLLTKTGILVIEDVQKIEWIDELKNETPEEFKQYIEIYDLRSIKNRWDDIMFVINMNK